MISVSEPVKQKDDIAELSVEVELETEEESYQEFISYDEKVKDSQSEVLETSETYPIESDSEVVTLAVEEVIRKDQDEVQDLLQRVEIGTQR